MLRNKEKFGVLQVTECEKCIWVSSFCEHYIFLKIVNVLFTLKLRWIYISVLVIKCNIPERAQMSI